MGQSSRLRQDMSDHDAPDLVDADLIAAPSVRALS
jgi:hypothetical protein